MTVQSVEHDKSKGDQMRLPCNMCGTITFHSVQKSIDLTVGFLPTMPHGSRHYQIIQCMGCREYSFRDLKKYPDFGTVSTKRKVRKMEKDEHLYPKRNIERRLIKQVRNLPSEVSRIYLETHQALLGSQPVLAGIGIRALLETVCKERSAPGRDLKEKIDNLAALGLLTKDNADFLHSLRVLGNRAAHEVIPHGEEKLHIAMDVIEHLLVTVYILPKKVDELLKP